MSNSTTKDKDQFDELHACIARLQEQASKLAEEKIQIREEKIEISERDLLKRELELDVREARMQIQHAKEELVRYLQEVEGVDYYTQIKPYRNRLAAAVPVEQLLQATSQHAAEPKVEAEPQPVAKTADSAETKAKSPKTEQTRKQKVAKKVEQTSHKKCESKELPIADQSLKSWTEASPVKASKIPATESPAAKQQTAEKVAASEEEPTVKSDDQKEEKASLKDRIGNFFSRQTPAKVELAAPVEPTQTVEEEVRFPEEEPVSLKTSDGNNTEPTGQALPSESEKTERKPSQVAAKLKQAGDHARNKLTEVTGQCKSKLTSLVDRAKNFKPSLNLGFLQRNQKNQNQNPNQNQESETETNEQPQTSQKPKASQNVDQDTARLLQQAFGNDASSHKTEFDGAPISPRTLPPLDKASMAAMRDLANSSSNSDIEASLRRRSSTAATVHLGVGVAALAFGLFQGFVLAKSLFSLQGMIAVGCVSAGTLFVCRYVSWLYKISKARKAKMEANQRLHSR